VGLFDFLFSRSSSVDRVKTYVLREHGRGRPVNEILADKYVTNRCSAEEVDRLFEDPDLIAALGEEALAQARAAHDETRPGVA
jgi:hypothetical protein